jgi:hypothetical protein
VGQTLRLEDFVSASFTVEELPAEPRPGDRATQEEGRAPAALRSQLLLSVERFETRLKEFEGGLRRLIAAADELTRLDPPPDLDPAIEGLRKWEEELRPQVERSIASSKRTRASVLRARDPSQRERLIEPVDRHITASLRTLALLRDARWQLLALRSQADPEERKKFESVGSLLEFLHRQP